jgi:DNA-binding NtrC family response regulator
VKQPFVLQVLEGEQRGTVWPVRKERVVVGRSIEADIVIQDREVSRQHVILTARPRTGHQDTRTPGGDWDWFLEDNGSQNGTRVNGVPAQQRQLHDGDEIRIGNTTLQVGLGDDRPAFDGTETVAGKLPGTDTGRRKRTDREFEGMIGNSAAIQNVYSRLEKAFSHDATVLVTGESGTGKELIARALHQNGPHRDGPYVVVHCAALAPGTLESELFGHEKGAFTGAVARRSGRFELADGGTLFLDEIGEIPQEIQVKLLRVLEYGEFSRVGGSDTINSSFRLVAATNRDLAKEVKNGNFREDLFYRLKVIQLHLPPLRERGNDVKLLAEHYLEKFCNDRGLPPKRLSEEATRVLLGYPWPGNIRELRNYVERLTLFHDGVDVEADDVQDLANPSRPVAISLGDKKDEVEKLEILRVLNETGWNKKKSAEILGIDRKTLYARIAKWDLTPES